MDHSPIHVQILFWLLIFFSLFTKPLNEAQQMYTGDSILYVDVHPLWSQWLMTIVHLQPPAVHAPVPRWVCWPVAWTEQAMSNLSGGHRSRHQGRPCTGGLALVNPWRPQTSQSGQSLLDPLTSAVGTGVTACWSLQS